MLDYVLGDVHKNMNSNNFVYGNSERIFINTDMGCEAKCQYCYLPHLGIKHNEKRITAYQAIELVEKLKYYKPGEKGNIISIGCYSECMDEQNVKDSITLVKYFLNKGNFVQLATKKKIKDIFFEEVIKCKDYEKHLWIYISLPVITESHRIEKGTDSPYERMNNFEKCKKYNINSVLYIKPFLAGLTNQDINIYRKIISGYDIPVVVGQRLSTQSNMNETLVGEKRLYEYKAYGMDEFIIQLENAKTYLHSVDCIINKE